MDGRRCAGIPEDKWHAKQPSVIPRLTIKTNQPTIPAVKIIDNGKQVKYNDHERYRLSVRVDLAIDIIHNSRTWGCSIYLQLPKKSIMNALCMETWHYIMNMEN
jgi:hypothetical protein